MGAGSLLVLPHYSNAEAAPSEFNIRMPGVVDINTELGNGPADINHEGLRRNLDFALTQSKVQPGATYEIKAVPGVSGLDFENGLKAAQVKWYAQAGDIVRDEFGLEPGLLTFISPADPTVEGVLHANYASSDDCESDKGLEFTLNFLTLGGAAKVKKVVGPGTVDQHFNEDTVHLYDRWGQSLDEKIIPKAKEYGLVCAPESLRIEESGALLDVERFSKYVKEKNSPFFKMQLDTAHLMATYGNRYLRVLEEAIKDGTVEHLHISGWGSWNSADNRGAIHKDTPVGKDMKELFSMLHRVGYTGTIGIEVPHYLFGGAVGRKISGLNRYIIADPNNVLGQFAADEQNASVSFVMGGYNWMKDSVGRR